MPPKETNPFGNPKPFLRAAAAGAADAAEAQPATAAGDAAAGAQKSKKQMHRKDKVGLLSPPHYFSPVDSHLQPWDHEGIDHWKLPEWKPGAACPRASGLAAQRRSCALQSS
jgi:hypothetical protein